MEHFALLIFILSLATGYAACIISVLFFQKLKKQIFINYALFMLSLTMIVLGLTLLHYGKILNLNMDKVSLIANLISIAGSTICTYATPVFFFSTFGIEISKRLKIAIYSGVFIMILMGVLYSLSIGFEIIAPIAHFVIFTSVGYTIFYAFFHRNEIANQEIKEKTKLFRLISMGMFPFMVLDSVIKDFRLIPYNLTMPIFFFIVSIFSIRFAFDYFAQPSYLKNGKLTNYFLEKFNITNRESEIIGELIQGLSNKEISDKLFISYKTVENHLSNIYQKMQVKNRVQLNNLVQSNKE